MLTLCFDFRKRGSMENMRSLGGDPIRLHELPILLCPLERHISLKYQACRHMRIELPTPQCCIILQQT